MRPLTGRLSRALSRASFGLLLAVATCAPSGPSAHDPPAGSIGGTISYDGAAAGAGRALSIAVYRVYPPKGPPVASKLVERYDLPYQYSFDGLDPGTYYVGALIDVDPSDTRYPGMLNAARDPYGYVGGGQPIVVQQFSGVAGADIALREDR